MLDDVDRIECGQCGRWVLRYENGAVHTVCPRCGADVSVDVEWLITRLELELAQLRGLRDNGAADAQWAVVVEGRATAVVTVKREGGPVRYPRGIGG